MTLDKVEFKSGSTLNDKKGKGKHRGKNKIKMRAEGVSGPIWLHSILKFSDFSNFSDFGYKFRGIPNLYFG